MTDSQQFYHVSRHGILEGNITLSKDFTKFQVQKKDIHFSNDELMESLVNYFPEGITRQAYQYLADKIVYWHDYQSDRYFVPYMIMIELVFELVRKSSFPNMLSRFQSFFAFETLAEAQSFKRQNSKYPCMIYLVEGQRNIKLDMSLLKIGFNAAVGILLAEKYWSGRQSEKPECEVLLEPPIKIIRRVE